MNEQAGPLAIAVRAATLADLPVVVRFNCGLAAETESKTLDPVVLEAGVRAAFEQPDRLRYWVAESGGAVVGQAAVSREWSDWRNGWIWWLQSVYVEGAHRGQGVLRALVDTIRTTARSEANVIGLRLYVEKENHRAIRAYQALGLEVGAYSVHEQFWIEPLKRPASG